MTRKTKKTRKLRKVLLTVCCAALLVCVTIGATVAYLTTSTKAITNTFTTAGIDISLTETLNTDADEDGTNDSWSAQLVPGKEYNKNPVVRVDESTNVDVFLYVKIDNNISDYVDFTNNLTASTDWTLLSGTTNVYWRRVNADATTREWHLIGGDKVTIKSDLDDGTMADAAVTLTYTAYATQCEGFDSAEAAWNATFGAPTTITGEDDE